MFSINHVTISANNLKETIDFYKKFGFKEYKAYKDESVEIVMLKLENVVLEIFYYGDRTELPEHSKDLAIDLKTVGNIHFALGVDDIEMAKKFVEENRLYADEIVIKKGRLGKPYFFIKDPNNILMEIIEND